MGKIKPPILPIDANGKSMKVCNNDVYVQHVYRLSSLCRLRLQYSWLDTFAQNGSSFHILIERKMIAEEVYRLPVVIQTGYHFRFWWDQ